MKVARSNDKVVDDEARDVEKGVVVVNDDNVEVEVRDVEKGATSVDDVDVNSVDDNGVEFRDEGLDENEEERHKDDDDDDDGFHTKIHHTWT